MDISMDPWFEFIKPGKRWYGTIFIPQDTPNHEQILYRLRDQLWNMVSFSIWGDYYTPLFAYTQLDYDYIIDVLKHDFPEVKPLTMPHACDICAREFSRKANLVRHRKGVHGVESEKVAGEEHRDPETDPERPRDIFDDMSSNETTDEDDNDTEPIDSADDTADESMMSEEDSAEEDGSMISSSDEYSTVETDSGSDSENDGSVDMNSSDESENGYDSGDEEEWTLYRDCTIPLAYHPSDVPQRVIKEAKRAGKTFYLIQFAALPHKSTEIVYSKNWVSAQTLMKKYGYHVLK
ncbi:Crystallin, lambda 1 [Branchiostoma belcheri]|nr:Crystallin, lambda 1 [Branchiostoma belcheri]